MTTINTNIGQATIGFANFAEAQDFANKNNMTIALFSHRLYDNSQNWRYCGDATSEIDLSTWDFETGRSRVFFGVQDFLESQDTQGLDEDELESVKVIASKIEEGVQEGQIAVVFTEDLILEDVTFYPHKTMKATHTMTVSAVNCYDETTDYAIGCVSRRTHNSPIDHPIDMFIDVCRANGINASCKELHTGDWQLSINNKVVFEDPACEDLYSEDTASDIFTDYINEIKAGVFPINWQLKWNRATI